MRLLKSGRVPPTRLGPVIEQIAARGNADDLAYLFDQALQETTYEPELRLRVYELLAEAAATRKVIPSGDLSRINQVISAKSVDSATLRLAAIRLAGLWKVDAAASALEEMLADTSHSPSERQAALGALTEIGGDAAQATILRLIDGDGSVAERASAIAALSRLDLETAANRAAGLLPQFQPSDNVSMIVDAFLNREGGTQALADALTGLEISRDTALRALRHMYSVGRSDEGLSAVLGKFGGIDTDPMPLTPEQVALLVDRVALEGDAARGEEVFRRADLACLKCHAVSKAGGQIGPDLSPLGASSPVDYIINSISNPDQQIKEAFTTRVVVTLDGLVHQGIVIDRTDEQLVLKEATGHQIIIPTANIDEEAEGKSLMPKGLMKFMTEPEFIDLVKFLSMLGKPGTEYAIRETPRMQRWRVYTDAPDSIRTGTADEALLEEYLSGSPAEAPAYSRVNGDLPLRELISPYGPIIYLSAEVEVSREGVVGFRFDSAEGVSISVGAFTTRDKEFETPLSRGLHQILLRVDTRERSLPTLRLDLFRVPGSPAEFEVVDGE